jgi:hypothetical protein
LLFQVFAVRQIAGPIARGVSDFSGFYTAGKIVESGNGNQLYDESTQARVEGIYTVRSLQGGFLPYNHAPFEALLFAPLAMFPYGTAFWIWWGINLPLAYLAFFLLRSEIARVCARPEFAVLALAIFPPLLASEMQGQDSILSLLLFTVCFICLQRNRPGMAGCALALSCFKPQLALVMIAVLAVVSEQRWRILRGFLATCLGLLGLSVGFIGWHACASYPAFLVHFASGYDEIGAQIRTMPNLRGLLFAAFDSVLSHRALLLLVVLLSALLGLATIRAMLGKVRPVEGRALPFALLVTLAVLVGYHGNFHDLTLLLLPLALVCNWLVAKGIGTVNRKLLVLCVAVFLGGLFLPTAMIRIYGCATIVLFVLLYRELRLAVMLGTEGG